MPTAGGTNIAGGGIGIDVDRIGKPVQANEGFPLAIIEIRARFLIKADAYFFALLRAQEQCCFEAEIIICAKGTVGILAGGLGVGVPRTHDGAADSTLGENFPHAEEEATDGEHDDEQQRQAPAEHQPLGRIVGVILIVCQRAAEPYRCPQQQENEPTGGFFEYVSPQIAVFWGDPMHR